MFIHLHMFCLEITSYPVVLPIDQVNEVPILNPTRACLPLNLENFLFTESDTKTNHLPASYAGKNSSIQTKNTFKIISASGNITSVDEYNSQLQKSEDILYEQIAQLNECNGEVLLNCFNTSEQSQSFNKGITMEVRDYSEKATLEESGNTDRKLKENSVVARSSKTRDKAISKSPKTSRKASDNRRRREKANEREKQRIVVLKNAMDVLKNTIPAARGKTKITKLELLKLAQEYINSLNAQLMEEPRNSYGCQFESSLTPQVDL